MRYAILHTGYESLSMRSAIKNACYVSKHNFGLAIEIYDKHEQRVVLRVRAK